MPTFSLILRWGLVSSPGSNLGYAFSFVVICGLLVLFLTAEGDLRLPIFLMGAKLSSRLGFAIREYADDRIEIIIPDADLLKINIEKINTSLKARGFEPVSYLPIRAGFISVPKNIDMALSAVVSSQIRFKMPWNKF